MENKAVCICNDPFRTGQCPVHATDVPAGYPNPPTEKTSAISSKDRIEPTKQTTWTGYSFKCSACNEPSIMHFGNFGMNFCPSCGSRVIYLWENAHEKGGSENTTANVTSTTESVESPS